MICLVFFVNRKIKVNFSKSVVILLLFTCELSCALHVLSLRLLVWSAGQQLAIQYKVRLEFRVASKSTHVANQSACCHLVYWSGPVNNSPILQKCPCNSISWLSNIIIFQTSRVQRPRGSSPQVCVVMNGHLVKPSRPSSSFGRRLRIIDLKHNLIRILSHLFCHLINKFVFTVLPSSHGGSKKHFNIATASWVQTNDRLNMFQIVDFGFGPLTTTRINCKYQRIINRDWSV